MSEPLNKIRIKIAESEIAMTVTAEQEARLRAAGRVLNERIKQFRDLFGRTSQDVLPMIALEAVADQLLAEQQVGAAAGGFHQRLEHLHELLLAAPSGALRSGTALGRSETTGPLAGASREGTTFTGS